MHIGKGMVEARQIWMNESFTYWVQSMLVALVLSAGTRTVYSNSTYVPLKFSQRVCGTKTSSKKWWWGVIY